MLPVRLECPARKPEPEAKGAPELEAGPGTCSPENPDPDPDPDPLAEPAAPETPEPAVLRCGLSSGEVETDGLGELDRDRKRVEAWTARSAACSFVRALKFSRRAGTRFVSVGADDVSHWQDE